MAHWSETTLRSAASWKAFKEGKSLFESGAVSGAKAGENSWTGTVREGKRLFKTAVKILSPTNLETRCACPENQSTGALCAHGVAAGLATLAGGGQPAAVKIEPVAPKPTAAFKIALPVNWVESLKKGRLAVTVTAGSQTTAADERIGAWLAATGQKVALPLPLHLDGDQGTGFLRAAIDHADWVVNKTGERIEIREGARIPIETLERREHLVTLGGRSGDLVRLGADWWRMATGEISRIGLGNLEPGLERILEEVHQTGRATIPVPAFLENLERWQEWLDFPEVPWLEAIHFVPAPANFELSLDGSLQRLEATLRVAYGEAAPVVPGRGQVRGLPKLNGDHCEVRNWSAEKEAVNRLEATSFQLIDSINGRWVLGSESAIIQFLARHLPGFSAGWSIRESERFKLSRKQVAIVEPTIEILGSGDDWLSFNLEFESSDGSLVPAADIRRLLMAGRSGSGKKVVLSDDVSNLIEPLFADLELRQEGGHFIASKRAGEVIHEIRNKLNKKNETNGLELNHEFAKPASVKANLRAYQTEGMQWLLDRSRRFGGALLADDMGLGKTIQTIACVEGLFERSESGMVLVVATASLLGNWKAEFAKFAPDRNVRILHGPDRESQQRAAQDGDVVLTTFGTLPRDLAWYLNRKFKAVVVDEASLMRNPDTEHAKAISKLDAEVRIALTGTPIENGVRDLWSIFRFIQPGWLGSRDAFKERYESGAGDARVMERLRLKTSPFLLRRTKEQVAPELPSKIFIEEYCDLTSEQQSVYRDLASEGRKKIESLQDTGNSGAARMQVLTALLRLRQTCCDLALLNNDRFKQLPLAKRSGKLQRLMELVEEAVSGGHRLLVFSQFQTQLREIEKCLEEAGYSCLRLDGQTKKRQELVERFQTADGPPVFLISLKAGGYGLTLTAADIVVHFDPWWNPAAEAQATDRAHRIGQTRPVTVYRLITRGTVEEKVVSLQNKKRRIAAAIDETGGGEAEGWSDRELMDLIQG